MSKPEHYLSSRLALRVGAAAASALAIGVAACSSSPSQPGSGSGAATAGVTFRGTIYVSSQTLLGPKAWHLTKSFVDRVAGIRNCQAAAKTGDVPSGTFRVPSAQAPEPQDDIEVAGFHGPGTYTPTMLKHDKSDIILLPTKSGTQEYYITSPTHGRAAGKEVLFLSRDGSGQLVYSGAHLNGKAKGPAVAGLINWSCTS
jgi:hypothetical protein